MNENPLCIIYSRSSSKLYPFLFDMSSPKNHRKAVGSDKNKERKLSKKSSSFHGKAERVEAADVLARPRTVPNLLAGRVAVPPDEVAQPLPRLTRLLLNVTIHRSLGAVRVMMPPEAAVEDLIGGALRQYAKEQRLPVLRLRDASEYDLHYSQFSLESLDRDEKLVALGSRNYFLCPKTTTAAAAVTTEALTSRCSKEVDTSGKKGSHWMKFMNSLL